jgi:hypothetical protein
MFNRPEGLDMTNATFQPDADGQTPVHPEPHPVRALLVPLARETRAALTTAEAAAHLNRAPQTLRLWACREDGPLRPLRVHGRLAWPVAELRRILGA